MNRLRTAAIVAALLFATLIAFPSAAFANACNGKFAVGGYPRTHLVPPGYESVYSPGGIFPWERGGYNHGQSVGAANVVAAVDEFATRCPESRIDLFGHSYGAAVVHTSLEVIDSRPYASRVNVYLTGNPRHPGGVEDSWRWAALPGINFRGAGIQPRNVASFVDVCNARDFICDAPPITDPVRALDHMAGYLVGGAHRY